MWATACMATAAPWLLCTAHTQRWCRKYRDREARVEEAVRLAATLRGTELLEGWVKFSMLKMKGVLKSNGSFSYLRKVGFVKMVFYV